jgi:flagellar hook-associated protein 1
MSSFNGLHIGYSALKAQQAMQETIGQNIANVNTAGYSRQTVALLASAPPDVPITPPQPGLGVEITGIRRSADALLNRQLGQESAGSSYWTALNSGMSEVEGLFPEPSDNGINEMLSSFWSSWKDLSTDPTGSGARANVRQTAQDLASNIRRTYDGVTDFATKLNGTLAAQTTDINALAQEIAQINVRIASTASNGGAANDLQDRQDALLLKLSQLAGVQYANNATGTTTVMLGGHTLVGPSGATQMKVVTGGDGYSEVHWSDDDSVANVTKGELGATFKQRDWAFNTVIPQLNSLAKSVIDSVNTLHSSAYTADGRTGIMFFQGNDAHDIAVSDAVSGDLSAIAISAAGGQPGDASAALKIAALDKQTVSALGDSIGGFYASFISQIGSDVKQSATMKDNQAALVKFLTAKREDVSGVSLDEEAVKLVGAQRAYQAAARVITVVDQMLDTLINNTGMAGR